MEKVSKGMWVAIAAAVALVILGAAYIANSQEEEVTLVEPVVVVEEVVEEEILEEGVEIEAEVE